MEIGIHFKMLLRDGQIPKRVGMYVCTATKKFIIKENFLIQGTGAHLLSAMRPIKTQMK